MFEKTIIYNYQPVWKLLYKLGKVSKKIKWLDLSNAHLTPASQAERWIKKIQKLHNFCYVFIIFIITKFGENFEDKIDICFF